MKTWITALLSLSASVVMASSQLDSYNVVWNSPSKNSAESMPVGGRDIGMNVWVENGDLLFYAQRSGCFDENNEYLKLGRVRLQLDPNPFLDGDTFRQELKLQDGYVEIQGERGDLKTTFKLWVDVFSSVINMDFESSQPVSIKATYEGWRDEDVEHLFQNKSRFGCFSYDCYPGKVIKYADTVDFIGDSVLFYHRNRNDKTVFNFIVKQQSLEGVRDQLIDTQKNRTFGGLLKGEGFVKADTTSGTYIDTPYKGWSIQSGKPKKKQRLQLYSHIAQTETLKAWQDDLEKQASKRLAKHKKSIKWWHAFWDRSSIFIQPEGSGFDAKARQVGRNYQLFRYQLGCNAYGSYPTKFNGGNFTTDPSLVKPIRNFTPDWRAWGGGSFTAQNQRLVYWPMLKSGDFDAMPSQFEFYRRSLPSAIARVQAYWGHEGCSFTEQMENFGLPIAAMWGFPDKKSPRFRPDDWPEGVAINSYCRYHFNSQLEFSYMILEYHRYCGADISQYMDFIKQSIVFYDQHYQMQHRKTSGQPLDDNGKLVVFPSTACETYPGATNPADVISGLEACLEAMLALPEVSEEDKSYYRGMVKRLPDYSYDEVKGDKILKPARSWGKMQNSECPQFYSLFPFNRYDLNADKEAQKLFRDTWKHGTFRKNNHVSWHQDGIFFARMGLTDMAVDFNTKKLEDSGRRFPSFWGPGHDWVPDHNWGGSGMIGLQEMLMQTPDNKIYLLPAWPADWDVDFKLHAPQRTTVEGSVRDGKVVDLKVTPASRKADVTICTP